MAGKIVQQFLNLFLLAALLALQGIVFVVSYDYPDPTIQARFFTFVEIMPGICMLAFALLFFGLKIRLNAVDLVVALYLVYFIVHYHLKGSVVQERYVQFVLLGGLYFSLRVFQSFRKEARHWAMAAVFLAGIGQAVLGLKQIYGFSSSYHGLYSITGSFFNPGPYGGYMAFVFCLSASYLVRHYREVNFSFQTLSEIKRDTQKFIRYLFFILAFAACTLSFVVIPATLSRSAWLAVLTVAGLLIFKEFRWGEKIRAYSKRNLLFIFLSAAILVGALWLGIYKIRPASADGRLLAWKITLNGIGNDPLTGAGTGYFGGMYADAQAGLFATDRLSAEEIAAADCPTYAFNEYLQVASEQGIIGLLFLGVILFLSFRGFGRSPNEWQYGLLSLCVFAVTSYPFRILPLLILFVFSAGLQEGNPAVSRVRTGKVCYGIALFLFLAFGIYSVIRLPEVKNAHREWRALRQFYQMKIYDGLAEDYAEFYTRLEGYPAYLFEYGHILNKTNLYENSNRILCAGTRMSNDPMFFNILGNNYRELKDYEQAEASYRKAFDMLPNRIYPLYLLAKLHLERGDSLQAADYSRRMTDFIPKVESPATREMKKEIQSLIPVQGVEKYTEVDLNKQMNDEKPI